MSENLQLKVTEEKQASCTKILSLIHKYEKIKSVYLNET